MDEMINDLDNNKSKMDKVSGSKKLARLLMLLMAIMILAAALRFFRLDYQELRGDEAASWARVTQTFGVVDLAQRLIREGQPHPPIHYWLLQAWIRIFGQSEFALRSLSVLMSLLVVALIFRVTIRITQNVFVSMAAMLIAAVHPYQIWLAQDVKNMYEIVPIGLLIATLALPRMLHGDRRAWIVYAVSGFVGVFSHFYAVFGLIAHGVYLLFTRADRRSWARWIATGIVIAACVFIWFSLVWSGIAAKQFNRPGEQPLAAFLSDTLGDAAMGPTLPNQLVVPGTAIFFSLVALGALRLWRWRRAWSSLFVAWSLILLSSIFVITRSRAIYNTFYLSNAYPALYILAAVGLSTLTKRRIVLSIVSGVVLIGFGLSLRDYYFDSAYSKTNGLRRMGNEIALHGQPDDVILTNQPDPATIYYLRNVSLPIILMPLQQNSSSDQIDQSIDDLVAKYRRLWFIPVRTLWDPNGVIENKLGDRYLLAADLRFKNVRLQEYIPQPENLPQYQLANAQFAQGIDLKGSYVTVNGDANNRQPRGGEWLRVTLFWATSARLPVDYKVFVHVFDSNHQIVAQDDSMPHHGDRPTSQWQLNQIVLDDHEFQLPIDSLPKSLVIGVGLYDPNSGQRLKLQNGSDSVEIWSSTSP
jgi:4-amino-4-deoxy-L-arabinose transferase-like glycosyltransferase